MEYFLLVRHFTRHFIGKETGVSEKLNNLQMVIQLQKGVVVMQTRSAGTIEK